MQYNGINCLGVRRGRVGVKEMRWVSEGAFRIVGVKLYSVEIEYDKVKNMVLTVWIHR